MLILIGFKLLLVQKETTLVSFKSTSSGNETGLVSFQNTTGLTLMKIKKKFYSQQTTIELALQSTIFLLNMCFPKAHVYLI